MTLANTSNSNAEDVANYVIEQLSYNKDELLVYVWGPLFQGEEILGTKVEVRKKGEQGKITINFFSEDELLEILKKIVGDIE